MKFHQKRNPNRTKTERIEYILFKFDQKRNPNRTTNFKTRKNNPLYTHTYIHIYIYREREYQGVPRRDRAWRGDQRCWERRGGALFSSPWICFWFQNSDSDQSIVCDSNLIKSSSSSSSSSFGFGFVALLWEFWFRFAVKEREWERELEVLGEEVVWVSLRFVIRWFVRVWAFKAQFDCSKNWASLMFSSYNGLN